MSRKLNKRELSEAIGRSERTITEWQKEGLPFKAGKRKGQENIYNLVDVIEFMLERERGKTGTLEQEKTRLLKNQADKVKIETDQLLGKLVPAEKVETVWTSMIANCRAKMLSLPVKLAAQLSTIKDPKQIQQLLKTTINEALNEMVDYDPSQYTNRNSVSGAGNKKV